MPRKIDLPDKLKRLRDFFHREKRLPGYDEMLDLFEYRSKNAVFGLLDHFQREGYITKAHGKIAPTEKLMGQVRLLGAVHAGFPSPAEEELLDTLSLDQYLVKKPDATFMLKVEGDSMIDAGIHPGDMVLVERGGTPKTNDIVIAHVDGEWTMKYYTKDDTGIVLQPANAKYEPIRPRNSLEFAGIVRGVVRRYE